MITSYYLQEKVVFVTCEDDDKVNDIRKLDQKHVRLSFFHLFYHITSFLLEALVTTDEGFIQSFIDP